VNAVSGEASKTNEELLDPGNYVKDAKRCIVSDASRSRKPEERITILGDISSY